MPVELENLLKNVSVLDAVIWLGIGYYIIRQLWKSRKAFGRFMDVMENVEILPETSNRVDKLEARVTRLETFHPTD